jgi:alpha-1,3-fucosyltransferase
MGDNVLSPPLACPIQKDKKIIILYWTTFYHFVDFANAGLGGKPFAHCESLGVNGDGCVVTTDRNLLNQSDAVMFHFRCFDLNDMPPPAWRRPHQHFILFEQESPVHTAYYTGLKLPLLKDFFNRTMTYRRDSDIAYLNTHGRLRCTNVSSPSCLDFPHNTIDVVNLPRFNPAVPLAFNLTLKNRAIAWFVSKCHTTHSGGGSYREYLVQNLSSFISVDIYGGCATKPENKCNTPRDCNLMLSQYYRFYLSFENSLCPDYVTEKLYRPMAYDTVPVVYGGSDYSFYLPAGSYINAMDYDSPQSLANYLKKLMTDDELYLSYFRWREHYAVDTAPKDAFCQLCKMLRNPDVKAKTYANMSAWWLGETINHTCMYAPPKSLVFNQTG